MQVFDFREFTENRSGNLSELRKEDMGAGASAQAQNRVQSQMLLQMRREAAILTNDGTCSQELAAATREKNAQELADQIDQFFTKGKLENGFYDSEFLRALGCILRIGLTVDKNLTASAYVKEFFTNQKQIGPNSADGVALMTGVKGVESMFVIKAPKNPQVDNLIHEYFIAAGGAFTGMDGVPRKMIGTNWLRKFCPNYAQILAAFRCGPPDVDPLTKTLRSWCNTDTPTSFVNYVVYEKVPGRDFRKHLSTISAVDYITTILQIAYALEIGQIHNGFTHYDLHFENIILRPVNLANEQEEVQIPFVISSTETVYIQSKTVATMIDFGRSHVQCPAPAAEAQGVPTEHFGYFGFESMGQFADKSRPYFDLYKILGFSLHEMLVTNNLAINEVWPIMGFFGIRDTQAFMEWIKRGLGEYFSLGGTPGETAFCLSVDLQSNYACLPEDAATMFNFIEYVQAQFPNVWANRVFKSPMTGQKVLSCGADCATFAQSVQNMTNGGSTVGTPATNLAAVGDLRNVITVRNNLNERGTYFAENFPQSTYGPKLNDNVQEMDNAIIQTYEQTSPAMAQQILAWGEKVKQDYNAIGYPIVYSEVASNEPAIYTQELMSLNGYLDRMQNFVKSYMELKEFYEAGEDMAHIAGQTISQDLQDYLSSEIAPLYQAYDASKNEIRYVLENTPVHDEYLQFRQDLIVRTI